MELVVARLTGVIAGNQCTQFASQLVDHRTLDAPDYDPVLVAASGVDIDRLPPLRSVTNLRPTIRQLLVYVT